MNLRVDLILESEQRSASRINLKSLTRIVAIIVPVLIGLVVASVLFGLVKLNNDVKTANNYWEITQPKLERAKALAAQVQDNEAILKELKGWKKSHMVWHEQLEGLRRGVPPMIQLSALKISHTIQLIESRDVARVFAMTLTGRATGPSAKGDVERLKRQLQRRKVFSQVMGEVNVVRFEAPSAQDADEYDRTFRIECVYQPRNF